MRRLQFVAQLGVSFLIATPAYPQSVEPNIGFMSTRSANDSTRVVAAFVNGLLWNLVNASIAVWLLIRPRGGLARAGFHFAQDAFLPLNRLFVPCLQHRPSN